MAAGFGSVFGTPVAGAIFAVEVLTVGRLHLGALLPALVAAFVGDRTTRALGIVHTLYAQAPRTPLSPRLALAWLVFAIAIALCSMGFVVLTHRLKHWGAQLLPRLPLRMALGGVVVVLLWRLAGTSDYLGLGVPTIQRAFVDPALPVSAFAAKLLFTAVTLGSGFLGGEVTPLFFVGATLGTVLARLLGLPLELGAGVGLAAVFGAAANTPVALSIMAVELLGGHAMPHVLIVAVIAFLLSGHRGIYPAQRLLRTKHGRPLDRLVALRDYREPPDD
jgi:H+/Cl- antiporter ClcA